MNAPIIVSALLGDADFARLNDLRRRHFPPERNRLDAHLTLFHHLPPSLADELTTLLRGIAAGDAPAACYAGLIDLGRGTAVRVRSIGLEAIRADLAGRFAELLIPQDRAGWRPHVTIQNKVAGSDAKALQAALHGRFDDGPLRIAGLAAWWYRGGPWERLAEARFR